VTTDHEAFLAYAPRGPGLMCAVVYFTLERDIYGWWTGFHDYRYMPAYFKLERFYAHENTVFLATEGSDLYGGWRYDYGGSAPALDRPVAVDERIAHRLGQLQDLFFNEWLFAQGDPKAQGEVAAYTEGELALEDINIRPRRLNKLDHHGAVWIYRSPGLDGQVIDYLSARWPLDYGKQ
jgi:hypothetical protein